MSTEHPLSVSVAILTWNRRDHVLKAIESVYSQTYKPMEIVVVDSASTDDTVDAILTRYPDVMIIRLHRNLGCPEGRNVSLANCSGDVIYALDDDGWLAQDTLEICVDRFMRDPSVGVVASRILAPDEINASEAEDFRHYTFSGGASAIRRKVLEEVGYYPSDFFRQAEESDLSLRIMERGYTILNCPAAIMYHERSPINRNDKLFHFFNTRNELYTVFRCYPFPFIIPLLFQKIVSWNLLGARAGALHYTLSGMFMALIRLPRLLMERNPVSISTLKQVVALKMNARRRDRFSVKSAS